VHLLVSVWDYEQQCVVICVSEPLGDQSLWRDAVNPINKAECQSWNMTGGQRWVKKGFHRRATGCSDWEEDFIHRRTEIKAGQDVKHSKTERLQTVVFVLHCSCSSQTQYPHSLNGKRDSGDNNIEKLRTDISLWTNTLFIIYTIVFKDEGEGTGGQKWKDILEVVTFVYCVNEAVEIIQIHVLMLTERRAKSCAVDSVVVVQREQREHHLTFLGLTLSWWSYWKMPL